MLMKFQCHFLSVPVAILGCVGLICTSAYAMDTGILDLAVTQEETTLQARVGVAVIDTDSGLTWQHRGDERFPLNSTHKALSCAAGLAQADRHKLNLEQAIPIERTALVTYSPVTERVPPGGTLTLRELCRAAVSISDNTAANLALDAIGGARTFTAFMRSIGDDKTRLDRREPTRPRRGMHATRQRQLRQRGACKHCCSTVSSPLRLGTN